MRKEGSTTHQRVRPVTSDPLKSLQELLRNFLGTELGNGFVVVTAQSALDLKTKLLQGYDFLSTRAWIVGISKPLMGHLLA